MGASCDIWDQKCWADDDAAAAGGSLKRYQEFGHGFDDGFPPFAQKLKRSQRKGHGDDSGGGKASVVEIILQISLLKPRWKTLVRNVDL